ncbi:hypothetical protein JEZ13_06780 [bacterium]|nr:hypothetical protein [bacterium]
MDCTDLKKEMNVLAQGLKIGVQEKIVSEDFADKEAERLNKLFQKSLTALLMGLFKGKETLVESFNIDNKIFFYGSCEYYDEAKGEEYQQMFYELNLNWFELLEKIIHYDCDGYDLDYTLSSELNKIFSESPEHRRERLEEPLERQKEEIDRQLEILEEKKRDNTYYEVKFDQKVFDEFVVKIEKLTYEN